MNIRGTIRVLAGIVALAAICAAQAAPATLEQQLAANRSDIGVENGQLAGGGASVLAAALRDAQFVFLGEDHGIAQVAQFADALYTHLQPLGFHTLALEVGPYTAAELNRTLAGAAAEEQHRRFLQQHAMTVPFYNTREEYSFLEHARALSGSRFRIIGFDQELMGASGLLLEEVERQKLTPALRGRVERLRQDERKAEADAKSTGNPMQLFMMTAPAEELTSLEQELQKAKLGARPIINLLASRHIYELFGSDGYRSNVERSLLMRRYFHEAYREGEKVMLKAGGEHAFKGINPLRNRDLGNHIAEQAEGRGQSSVHIIMLGGGGEQLMFAGAGAPMKPSPITVDSRDSQLTQFKPIIDEALRHDGWSLFDLRPLRAMIRKLKPDAEMERIVLGFDFAVIVPQAKASQEIR